MIAVRGKVIVAKAEALLDPLSCREGSTKRRPGITWGLSSGDVGFQWLVCRPGYSWVTRSELPARSSPLKGCLGHAAAETVAQAFGTRRAESAALMGQHG